MRVLIVDDNELLLEVAKVALSSAGFEVITSDSALGFSAALSDARPHVALVDVMMPALNGNHLIELANRRQRRRKKVKRSRRDDFPDCIFVLHSNLPESELESLAERCGARGFIRKADRPAELGAQLEEFLLRLGVLPPNSKSQSHKRKVSR